MCLKIQNACLRQTGSRSVNGIWEVVQHFGIKCDVEHSIIIHRHSAAMANSNLQHVTKEGNAFYHATLSKPIVLHPCHRLWSKFFTVTAQHWFPLWKFGICYSVWGTTSTSRIRLPLFYLHWFLCGYLLKVLTSSGWQWQTSTVIPWYHTR